MTNTQNNWVPALNECGVLIAGGTSGVGLAAAERFAAAGVTRIALVGRNAERGDKARSTIVERCPGTRVVFIQADANQANEALKAVAEATAQLGSVDVLVNATVGPFGPRLFHETPIEDVAAIVIQQLMGPLIMSRAVMPGMREKKGGVIISISSDAGKVATPGESVIGAAMAGINMFSRGLAMEAKRSGIRVNAITPSLIEGTLTYDRIRADPFSWKIFERAASQAHLGVVQPDDLANLIVFLASPQASRITGQVISVNGGISAA